MLNTPLKSLLLLSFVLIMMMSCSKKSRSVKSEKNVEVFDKVPYFFAGGRQLSDSTKAYITMFSQRPFYVNSNDPGGKENIALLDRSAKEMFCVYIKTSPNSKITGVKIVPKEIGEAFMSSIKYKISTVKQ